MRRVAPIPAALRVPGFRRVWLANVASNAGTWLHVVAAGFLILELTGSAGAVGALALVTRGPAIFLFALAGDLADRFDRRTVGIVTFGLQALAAASLSVVTWLVGPNLAAIYGLTFVMGVGFSLSLPSLLAVLPALVPLERFSQAVSINAAGINVARLAGPAIGGIMLATVGAAACFAVNATTYLALMITLAFAAPRAVPRGPRPSLAQAARHARRDPALRRLLLGMAAFVGLAAPVQELAPVVAARLDAGPQGIGYLLSAMGGGALIGAYLFERLSDGGLPRHRALPISALAFSVGLAVVALSGSLPVTLAGMLFAGVFWIWNYSGTNTAIQLRSPAELTGRMLGFYQLSVIGPLALGALLAGLVAEHLGIGVSLGVCAGLLATWGAWSLRHAVPEIDRGWDPGSGPRSDPRLEGE